MVGSARAALEGPISQSHRALGCRFVAPSSRLSDSHADATRHGAWDSTRCGFRPTLPSDRMATHRIVRHASYRRAALNGGGLAVLVILCAARSTGEEGPPGPSSRLVGHVPSGRTTHAQRARVNHNFETVPGCRGGPAGGTHAPIPEHHPLRIAARRSFSVALRNRFKRPANAIRCTGDIRSVNRIPLR